MAKSRKPKRAPVVKRKRQPRDSRGRFVSKAQKRAAVKLNQEYAEESALRKRQRAAEPQIQRARRFRSETLGPGELERLPRFGTYPPSFKYTWGFEGRYAVLKAVALLLRAIEWNTEQLGAGRDIKARAIVEPIIPRALRGNTELHPVSTPSPTYRSPAEVIAWLLEGGFWLSYKGLEGYDLKVAKVWVILISPLRLEDRNDYPTIKPRRKPVARKRKGRKPSSKKKPSKVSRIRKRRSSQSRKRIHRRTDSKKGKRR